MVKNSGAVSAGHESVAATAGLILKEGGNAADAAIAAYLVACVAEPCMASLGAGFFALYWPAKGTPVSLDAFCQTPEKKRPVNEIEFFPVEVDFGTEQELFYAGMGSVAVPAVVAGLFELHARMGSMPLTELVLPAVDAARKGVPLSDFQHMDLQLLQQIYRRTPVLQDVFFPNEQIISPGTPAGNPEFADFLEYLAREDARAFYEGEFAQRLDAMSAEFGGHISLQDMADIHTVWAPAVKSHYRGADIFTPASSSYGGWLIRHWFETLERTSDLSDRGAMETALWKTTERARNGIREFQNLKRNGTSHFNVLDRWGNAVAITFSIGEGSGRVVPGTGIHLNNMLGEAALLPEGFHSWTENDRMVSMMAPVGLWHPERNTRMVLGSGGAGRIPIMLAQVMQDWISGDRHLEEVIHAPRCHYDGSVWQLEPGCPAPEDSQDQPVKQWDKFSLYFGGVHALWDHNGGLEAVGDPRRDGVGLVF